MHKIYKKNLNLQNYSFPSTSTVLPTPSSVINRGNVIVSTCQYSSDKQRKDNVGDDSAEKLPAFTVCTGKDEGSNILPHDPPTSDPLVEASLTRQDHTNSPDISTQSEVIVKNGDGTTNASTNVAKNFSCEYCGKGFRHKSYFEYHLRTHRGDRPFKCDICQKTFFERSKLNRHLNSCHNVKNSYYADSESDVKNSNTCSKCNKTFPQRSGLQAHMQTHDGIRSFVCKICGKNYSGLTALKNHEKSHQGTKTILCDICGKAFLLKKYLDLHLSATHKLQPRKKQCSKCGKAFFSLKDLKRHQLLHSNTRDFKCTLCQTAFKRKDNLNRHLKLTHAVTPEPNDKLKTMSSDVLPSTLNQSSNTELPPHDKTPVTPIIRQVSVIRSTQEFIMSMSLGQIDK